MKQRILALCLAMLMVLSVALPREASTAKADDFDGYVYFTVERITLGQGFVMRRTLLPILRKECSVI